MGDEDWNEEYQKWRVVVLLNAHTAQRKEFQCFNLVDHVGHKLNYKYR